MFAAPGGEHFAAGARKSYPGRAGRCRKIQNSKFGRIRGQILNFEFCRGRRDATRRDRPTERFIKLGRKCCLLLRDQDVLGQKHCLMLRNQDVLGQKHCLMLRDRDGLGRKHCLLLRSQDVLGH